MRARFLPPAPLPARSTTEDGNNPGRGHLAPAEAALLVVTGAHLAFLPWALGSVHAWSQLTSLCLAALGLLLALLPRATAAVPPGTAEPSLQPRTSLWRWPPFWAGLVLLGYLLLQAGNPAWERVSDATQWWLEPRDHVGWLPAGVAAPFPQSGPTRQLIVYAALLLLAASVWIGFTRRKSYRVLLTLLAGNAAALALFGLVQRLDGTPRIFWTLWPSNDRFIASFIYPNHAGAYFNLLTALAVGLAWWSCRQQGRAGGTSSRLWLFTLAAVLAGTLVIHTQSRMAALLLVTFLLLLGAIAGFRRLWRKAPPVRPGRPRSHRLLFGVAALLTVLLSLMPARRVWNRLGESATAGATVGADRSLVRQAAASMLRDRWGLGWGAGCFRHVFPLYAMKHPAIYRTPAGVIMYWEHAHNDWLEIPLELGLVGTLPLLAGLLWLTHRLVRVRFWRSPVALPLVLAGALTLAHAWVDFVFQSPAVLFTWVLLLVAAIRWCELDQPPTPGAEAGTAGGRRPAQSAKG